MNKMKKTALVLVLSVLTAVVYPVFSLAVTGGVQSKIDVLLKTYNDGTYFTSDGKPCSSSQADNCNIKNIPSRNGLPSGEEVYRCEWQGDSWSCRSFGNYVYYYLFGCHYTNSKNVSSLSDPCLGDFILFNNGSHTAIYLYEDENYFYVYDGNGDHQCGVHYNNRYSKSSYRITGAYHAYNYDSVNAGQTLTYFTPSSDNYYIKSVKSGKYADRSLGVSDKKDGSGTFTLSASGNIFTLSAGTGAYLTVAQNYSLGIGSTVNDFSRWRATAVNGGYIIESEHFPGYVLTVNGGRLTCEKYRGAGSQLFKLEHSEHKYVEKVIQAPTCTQYGYSQFVCGCGVSFYEYVSPTGHNYTSKTTVAPTASVCGFDRYVCARCGYVMRNNFVKKTGSQPVSAAGVSVRGNTVTVRADVKADALCDLFPDFVPLSSDNILETGTCMQSSVYGTIMYVVLAGDADCDGKVGVMDARMTLRSAIGLEKCDSFAVKAADWDSDGRLTVIDARFELRLAIGLENADTIFKAASK